MAKIDGNKLLVKALEAQGAKKIFSIPGGQLMGVYEAIRRSGKIELLVPRQEGAGALMACGYALASGDAGVVISTVGAGIIYELAGLIYAFKERIPVVSIAPQVQSWRIKPIQESLQAMDQDELFAPITKFNAIIYHSYRIPQLVARAWRIALAPQPGPVHLDLPLDVAFQKVRVKKSELENLVPPAKKTRFTGKRSADPKEIEKAKRLLAEAKRPLALVGRMLVRSCSALSVLEEFLQRTQIPAICSNPAFSALSAKSRLFLGTFDLYSEESALELFAGADLLLYLEPDEEVAEFARKILEKASGRAIMLCSLPTLFASAPIDCALEGDADLILSELKQATSERAPEERASWQKELSEQKEKALERKKSWYSGAEYKDLIHSLKTIDQVLGKDDYLICESELVCELAKIYLKNFSLGRVILIGNNLPKGAGFPLALGIKAGAEKARVFLITDRRNFKYHSRELQTQARYGLGICSLVFPEKLPFAKSEPNFAQLAKSLGAKGISVSEPSEEINQELLETAGREESGTLIEIRSPEF